MIVLIRSEKLLGYAKEDVASQMIKAVANGDVELADDYYSSLKGEHIGSPLLPEATLILALSHMYYEEYLLTEYFLDEYTKRYATLNQKEEADLEQGQD